MKIKVNKDQFLDDYEYALQKNWQMNERLTRRTNIGNFVTEEVTEEQLLEYIKKGYGIKINC